MKTLHYLLFASLVLFACEETVKLDTRQTTGKIVIEGLITNATGRQFVKLSRNADFYQAGQTPRVINGIVSVKDDLGNDFPFIHNPRNHPDSLGYYLPSMPFTGKIGRTYALAVNVDGQVFTAQDKMTQSLTLDSLSTAIDPDEVKPAVKGRFYQVLLFAKEPVETKDFYMFKCYRNDSLIQSTNEGPYLVDDQSLRGTIAGYPVPVHFGLNDKAELECLSLSHSGYLYFYDLNQLIGSRGGLFDSPPSNPRTNLSNGALGFFQVSAVANSQTIIK